MKFLKIGHLFGFLRFYKSINPEQFRLLGILIFLVSGSVKAQTIQLRMSSNPSPYISDWREKTETATLLINNSSGADILVKVKTELYDGNGTLVAYTDASKMPVLNVPPGQHQYSPENIFPVNAINYKGNLERTTTATGRIPDDNYQICVSLTDLQGNIISTNGKVCNFFNLLAYQAPILINPTDNENIKESAIKGIFFRWSPVIPSPKTFVTYRLQIWEVLEGQNSMTALRSNQPIVEKDLPPGILQTQWPIEFALPEAGRKYIWTITPLDDQERKLVDGNGFAQPFEFGIMIRNPEPFNDPSITLISPTNGEVIDPKIPVTFTWSKDIATISIANNDIYHSLKIVEIIGNQTPGDAMKMNKSLVDPCTLRIVQKISRYQLLPDQFKNLETGKKYAWCVRTGKTWDEGASQSEVWSFSIRKDSSNQRTPGFGWGIKFGKKSLSQCADFGICDIIISSASMKPDRGSGIGTFTAIDGKTLEIKINKATGITAEGYQRYFASGYFVFDEDFSFGNEIKEKLKMTDVVNVAKGKYKVNDRDGNLVIEFGGDNIFYNTTCEEAKKDLEKKQNDLDSLKKELAGLGKRIRDTTIAKRDCEEELKNAEAELAAANAELKKRIEINKEIERNIGPGKRWPDKESRKKEGGDYEQALKDAQKAADDALAKVNKWKPKCPELTKALDALKGKSGSLPADIARGEKAVTEAAKTLEECILEKDKCKEGEIREAPGKSSTSETYLCATPDTKVKTDVFTNLDGTLTASTEFSDYLKKGIIIIKKIPVIKKVVKIVALPAELGADILAAIPKAGMFGRLGLKSVTVVITIGPLHKFTLIKTDLEICKNGVWVPFDKKKCELKDEGEVPSTEIKHTWTTGGSGDTALSELTAAGTGFKEALAAAIQKLITDAVTTPENLEDKMKDCQ